MTEKPRVVYSALVIFPNDKIQDMGDLLAVARAEAQKKEHTRDRVFVKALVFVPEMSCYVAVYGTQRVGVSPRGGA